MLFYTIYYYYCKYIDIKNTSTVHSNKNKPMNQLSNTDLHIIAQKSVICLDSRLVYIVPKISNGWSDGEIYLLEQYLDYASWSAWTYNCIKWWEIPTEVKRFDTDVTVRLTIKDIVVKFVKKDEQGKFVMRSIDEFDQTKYKNKGSRTGKRQLKRDLQSLYTKLVAWNILN